MNVSQRVCGVHTWPRAQLLPAWEYVRQRARGLAERRPLRTPPLICARQCATRRPPRCVADDGRPGAAVLRLPRCATARRSLARTRRRMPSAPWSRRSARATALQEGARQTATSTTGSPRPALERPLATAQVAPWSAPSEARCEMDAPKVWLRRQLAALRPVRGRGASGEFSPPWKEAVAAPGGPGCILGSLGGQAAAAVALRAAAAALSRAPAPRGPSGPAGTNSGRRKRKLRRPRGCRGTFWALLPVKERPRRPSERA